MQKPILIAAFYKFVSLPDYRDLRQPLLKRCHRASLRGTILLAEEGINATIAGQPTAVGSLISFLRADARFADLTVKESFHDRIPFGRMKVRLKREIVALKVAGIDPKARAGAYVEPEDWNRLVAQDEVFLLDARNDYEARMGTFRGAHNPKTEAFHELPGYLAESLDPARHKRVAMFCTGGIRCEKASAFLLARGFDQVCQLRGGILNYLEKIDEADSLWQGECFVFDERVSLDHRLAKGKAAICDDCKTMVSAGAAQCARCGSTNIL